MIVGEPSLMGGEMDDEDERFISRIENTQYDPHNNSSNSFKQQTFLNLKQEQISFPNSPQQQQQLSSMFINHSPTKINGELSTNSSINQVQLFILFLFYISQRWFSALFYRILPLHL